MLAAPRFLLGGVLPQFILCLGMLACCVITYHLGKAASGDGQGSQGGQYFDPDDEALGTILIIALAVQAGLLGILQAMAVSGPINGPINS